MSDITPKQFIQAAYSGDLSTVQNAIEARVDLDVADKNGLTALHWAAFRGNTQIVEKLLGGGADAHLRDKGGQTPIDCAIRQKHPQVAALIQRSALSSREAMFLAASKGDLNAVQKALAKGISPNSTDKDGNLISGVAVRNGHPEVVILLLNSGADIDALDKHDWSALGVAAHAGHIEIVKLLVSNGANLHLRNGQRGTALAIAISQGHRQVSLALQLHRAKYEGATPDTRIEQLIVAANGCDLRQIHFLLSQGVNPNSHSTKGFTALELASMRGDISVVNTLLQAGANPNLVGDAGFPALNQAVVKDDFEIVHLLLTYGADPNFVSDKGYTALGLAINNENLKIIEELLSHDADANLIDLNGDTRLHIALDCENEEPLQLLLQYGADPNSENSKGLSPVDLAAFHGKDRFVEALLRHGAKNKKHLQRALVAAIINNHPGIVVALLHCGVNPDTLDIRGFTVLGWVAAEGYYSIVKHLLEAGANPNITEKQQNGYFTPLHQAAVEGHIEIVRLLLQAGANPQAEDAEGNTALDYAIQKNHLDVGFVLTHLSSTKLPSDDDRAADVEVRSDKNKRTVIQEAVRNDEPLVELSNRLNSLVGLTAIKSDVTQLVNFLRVQKLRKDKGLSVPEQSLHMVFTGNPGTGKTTIARLIAQIYKSMGILSKGQFIETDRAGLVGGYLGQTAIKTQEVVESALGGVLFIDEAYSLTDSTHGHDMYGQEAVATLLKLMEDHRDDLIVIVAGYTEPMQKFIRSNPGLQSRFNKFLHFDDYAPAELTEIFRYFAAQGDYKLHPATALKLLNVFADLYARRDETFGNARLARNLFEKAINAHANRMVSAGMLDEASLVTLYPEDISSA